MKDKTRNTILYIIICVITLLLLVITLKLNRDRINENLSKANISDYISGIRYDEISNYVTEQPAVVLYVTNGNKNESFERMLIRAVKKHNLENEILYIDINNQNINDPIFENNPEFVIYKDGIITDIIDCRLYNNSNEIIKSLIERGIIND